MVSGNGRWSADASSHRARRIPLADKAGEAKETAPAQDYRQWRARRPAARKGTNPATASALMERSTEAGPAVRIHRHTAI